MPDGFLLWHTGRDRGDMVIRLLRRHPEAPAPAQPARDAAETRPRSAVPPASPSPIPARRRAIDLRPVLASLKVSKPLLPRCRAILSSIAEGGLERGYDVRAGVEKASLVIVANGDHLPFTLFEEQDTVPLPPPLKPPKRTYAWERPAPTTTKAFSGRLALRLEHRYRNRTWADRSRWRLEELLGDVLDHVDSLALAEIERQREAHEQGLRDLERWEAAVAAAREAYISTLNRRRMRDQAARSTRAGALRVFAERVRGAADPVDAEFAAQLRDWSTAIEAEADRLDPLTLPGELRWPVPAEIKPADLARFMPWPLSIYQRPVVPPFPLPPEPPAGARPGLAPLVRR